MYICVSLYEVYSCRNIYLEILWIMFNIMFNISRYSWFQTFAVIWVLYVFFWVFPRRKIVVGRRFGALCPSSKAGCRVYSTSSLWRWNWHRVPKRRPNIIWRRGNTQKTYTISRYIPGVTSMSICCDVYYILYWFYKFYLKRKIHLEMLCRIINNIIILTRPLDPVISI